MRLSKERESRVEAAQMSKNRREWIQASKTAKGRDLLQTQVFSSISKQATFPLSRPLLLSSLLGVLGSDPCPAAGPTLHTARAHLLLLRRMARLLLPRVLAFSRPKALVPHGLDHPGSEADGGLETDDRRVRSSFFPFPSLPFVFSSLVYSLASRLQTMMGRTNDQQQVVLGTLFRPSERKLHQETKQRVLAQIQEVYDQYRPISIR